MKDINNPVVLMKIWHGTTERGQPPMGLLFIGNSLKKAGYEVKIFQWTKYKALSRVNEIVKLKPLLIGFSIITGDPLEIVLKLCEDLKEEMSSVPIVFGGVHPTLEPEQCLKESCVDFVVLHEGEKVIVSLTNAIKDQQPVDRIDALGYKRNGKIMINPFKQFEKNLDQFEMDWSLIDVERYIWPSYGGVDKVLMGYTTTRGCPHNCGFCYNQFFNKRRWRCQSAAKVIEDINQLSKKHNFHGIVFFDDNFTANKTRALEILKGIDVTGAHIETRVDYINEGFLDALIDRKVSSLFLGIESGSDRLLKLISKGFTVKDTYRALNLIKKYPLLVKLSLIVGIPTEKLSEYRETLNLTVWCIENIPDVGFTLGFYVPYPRTPLFDLCIERGFKKPERFTDWKILDRWGTQYMPIPWTERNYLTTTEIKKTRILLGWMVCLQKSSYWVKFLLYPIIKFRFLHSGTLPIRILTYFEDILWALLRFLRHWGII